MTDEEVGEGRVVGAQGRRAVFVPAPRYCANVGVVDAPNGYGLGHAGGERDAVVVSVVPGGHKDGDVQGVKRLSAGSLAEYAKKHPDKIEAYKQAIAELKASKTLLNDWMATRPKGTEENNKKYAAFNESIQKATQKLAGF